MTQPSNDLPRTPAADLPDVDAPEALPSASRRDAVTKLAYASPVLASLLFTSRTQAQVFSPPPPPG